MEKLSLISKRAFLLWLYCVLASQCASQDAPCEHWLLWKPEDRLQKLQKLKWAAFLIKFAEAVLGDKTLLTA